MFKFKFGLIWTLFTSAIFAVCVFIPAEQRNGAEMGLGLYIFFILFEAIGIFLLYSGIKTIIKDKKTKKYGRECFGIVNDIRSTGASVNGNSEYKAVINIVNPETNTTTEIEEIIGFDYYKYPINSYVLCKYFEGDINIERLAEATEIPENIKQNLAPLQNQINALNVEVSADKDYAIIDGEQYKRVKND